MADNYELIAKLPTGLRIVLYRKMVQEVRRLAIDATCEVDDYTFRITAECLAQMLDLECPPTLKLTQAQREHANQYLDPG